jgi:hypothetical protein
VEDAMDASKTIGQMRAFGRLAIFAREHQPA